MVATRSLIGPGTDDDKDLRPLVRDLVALSNLQAIWSRADARQIAEGLGQLSVSMLDADFAVVVLQDPVVEVAHFHDRNARRVFSAGFFNNVPTHPRRSRIWTDARDIGADRYRAGRGPYVFFQTRHLPY